MDDTRKRWLNAGLRWLLCALFVAAGTMHFFAPKPYLAIMPPHLPHPWALVAISGVCEIGGGIGVVFPQPLRRFAGWGLILLLIAVFPANVQMALHGAVIEGNYIAPLWGWIRLPFQALFVGWVAAAAEIRWRPRRAA